MLKRDDVKSRIAEDPFAVIDLYERPEDDDICEPLVRALEDEDPGIRRAAVGALISLNDLHAASSIFGVLLGGSDHARRAAATVLCALPDPLSITSLKKALNDPVEEVRNLAKAPGFD